MKKICKLILTYLLLFNIFISSSVCDSEVLSSSSFASSIKMISIERKNKIVWKYKTINGVLYKRKYDYTAKKWIGDWIKA